MNSYVFKSCFKEDMNKLLEEKKLILATVKSYLIYLIDFDKWLIKNNIITDVLSEEIVTEWLKIKDTECSTTRATRCTVIRALAKNMRKREKVAYVVPNGDYTGINDHIAYVFSGEELKKLMEAFDNIKFTERYKYKRIVFSLIFKLLICCGFRNGELLDLKMKDVWLKEKIIKIHQGKEYVDRLVPLTDNLAKLCEDYYSLVKDFKNNDDYFFSNIDTTLFIYNKRISHSSLNSEFKRCLQKAGIKYLGLKEGPRMHDFRFTFITKCIRKIIKEGKNINVYLPIIQRYVGHLELNDTLYYNKPKEVIFNTIISKQQNIIPNIEGIEND